VVSGRDGWADGYDYTVGGRTQRLGGEIALALGVPPMLLGIPGDNTYANYQEANRSLWRQTVLPLVARTARALSRWLAPAWDEPLELRPDLDDVPALASEREALWARLDKATFLTRAEKRQAVGYGDDADMSRRPAPRRGVAATRKTEEAGADASGPFDGKYSPDQPRVPSGGLRGGQWTKRPRDGVDLNCRLIHSPSLVRNPA
jgi:Phage portal protein